MARRPLALATFCPRLETGAPVRAIGAACGRLRANGGESRPGAADEGAATGRRTEVETNDDTAIPSFTPGMERAAPDEERHAVTGRRPTASARALAAGCHMAGSSIPQVVGRSRSFETRSTIAVNRRREGAEDAQEACLELSRPVQIVSRPSDHSFCIRFRLRRASQLTLNHPGRSHHRTLWTPGLPNPAWVGTGLKEFPELYGPGPHSQRDAEGNALVALFSLVWTKIGLFKAQTCVCERVPPTI